MLPPWALASPPRCPQAVSSRGDTVLPKLSQKSKSTDLTQEDKKQDLALRDPSEPHPTGHRAPRREGHWQCLATMATHTLGTRSPLTSPAAVREPEATPVLSPSATSSITRRACS